MANKYITVGNNTELIPVIDCYAYIYDYGEGKTVLRIKVSDEVKSFAELKDLFASNSVIKLYEEVSTTNEDTNEENQTNIEFRFEYRDFTKEYKCDYSSVDHTYSIEITKKTDTELLVESNIENTLMAYEAIAYMYEENNK